MGVYHALVMVNLTFRKWLDAFGEPEQTSQQIESSTSDSDESTKKLIIHLENEVKKYQEREERLMQQIDRMQTLHWVEKLLRPPRQRHKQDATACDTDMPQHATTQQDNDNKKE